MNKYYILLYLLTMSESKIQINVFTSSYLNKTRIKCPGSDIKQVTDKEIELFNITNQNLNRGIMLELGKVPDDVFLKDPTPYGDLFHKYKWPDVKRKLIVKSATIVEFIKQEVVLKRTEYINNSTSTIESKIDASETVTNTVTAIWNKDGLPDDVIYYNLFIDFEYGRMLHQGYWRNSNNTSVDMALKQSNRAVKLESGKSVVTKLLADKIILLIEIKLDAYLVGNIVLNYAQLYGKYHFWAPTIGNIMKAAKLKNEVTTTFLLEVIYYAKPRLEVVDKDTGKKLDLERKRPKKKLIGKFNFS